MDDNVQEMFWYNYKTGKHEYHSTPADYTDYLPQNRAAQGLYCLYQRMGKSPSEAAIAVLTACIGEKVAP
jgi:hypothetical protein